jgi:glycosyltransferase involved in cell wall biosynthesis
VRYLAEAFVRVSFADPAVRLLLVGDGETADSVREILKRAELDARVHMPGMVPRQDVSGYLAAADILVSPHAETDAFIGSPVKIFEYMAAGRAIVASNVAQIGELLRDEETALLVTPADSEALADGIRRLHHDSGLRKRLGQTAQAEASHLHSWDTRLAASLDGQAEG